MASRRPQRRPGRSKTAPETSKTAPETSKTAEEAFRGIPKDPQEAIPRKQDPRDCDFFVSCACHLCVCLLACICELIEGRGSLEPKRARSAHVVLVYIYIYIYISLGGRPAAPKQVPRPPMAGPGGPGEPGDRSRTTSKHAPPQENDPRGLPDAQDGPKTAPEASKTAQERP